MTKDTDTDTLNEKVQENIAKKQAKGEWGKTPGDHFGYASDEERKSKRGLEDWELVETIPTSNRSVPKWFIAVIVLVLMIAIGLSFPFWGDRPGYERTWINEGFWLALAYLAVAGTFVYFMVRLYGPPVEQTEKEKSSQKQNNDEDA
ncbi:MAG: hypothetical protein ACE5EH_02190 [Gammaproteobacteria bacterium]